MSVEKTNNKGQITKIVSNQVVNLRTTDQEIRHPESLGFKAHS